MIAPNSDLALAEALAGSAPLAFKRRPDGSLCVIDRTGRKLFFTPQQVAAAQENAITNAGNQSGSKDPTVSERAESQKVSERTGDQKNSERAESQKVSERAKEQKSKPPAGGDKPKLSQKPVASTATKSIPADGGGGTE